MPAVELVYHEGCPNVAEARAQLLRAFAEAGMPPRWQEWRSDDDEAPPHARGHGSPTLLVDGRDVGAGEGAGDGASCRIYTAADGALRGVPDVEHIVRALKAPSLFPSSTGPVSWKANLAVLPGIGAALLPKVACPACWPAYAGVLSAIGLGFLLDVRYLFPLTAAFLAIALLALGYRAHARRGYAPLSLGLVATAVVLVGKFAFESDPAMYAGLAVLVAASVWNGWPRRRGRAACPACPPEEHPQPQEVNS